jgi:acetyl esterase/lipase
MVEPKMVSYEDFPASGKTTQGMKTLKTEPVKTCTCLDPIVYSERDGMQLTLQILLSLESSDMMPGFMPAGPNLNSKPFIVYVPGSAWMPQMLCMNVPQIAELAKRGYVIAVAQYRPSMVAPFPAQTLDIKAAVKYMKTHAAQYGVDPEQGFLWGDSSGGHTVLMAGITGDDIFPCSEDPGTSASVKGIIDFFGPTDLSLMCREPSTMDHTLPTSPEGMVLGNVHVLDNPDRVAQANPMTYITAQREIPPILIFHGDKDRLVPIGQSVMLYEKLRDSGKKADFYKLEGADHGSGEFSSKAVFDLIDAFIQENKVRRHI